MQLDGDDGGAHEPADDEAGPTVKELQEAHNKDKQALEYLVRQGFAPEHPVREAAEAQAAASKQAWDDAKPGKATTLRMRWAEEALTRARRSQAKQEQYIDELDREYEIKREAATYHLGELRAKTKAREEHLAEVARQAAVEFRSTPSDGGTEHLREAARALEGQVAPTLASLLERIPEGTPERGEMERVVGIIRGIHGTFTRASDERWADVFDIGDEADEEEDCGQAGGNQDDWWWPAWGGHGQHWRGSWDYHGGGWARGGWDGPHRRWQGSGPQGSQQGGSDPMDTAEVSAPSWMAPGGQGAAAIARANKRRALEEDDPNGLQGRHVGSTDEATVDHANAARLQAAFSDAALAAVGQPAPPTPTAEAHAALEDRRREAWDLAQDQEVMVSQDEIARMSSDELEAWIAANLL